MKTTEHLITVHFPKLSCAGKLKDFEDNVLYAIVVNAGLYCFLIVCDMYNDVSLNLLNCCIQLLFYQ